MNKKNDKNNIKGLSEDSPVFSDIPEVDKLYDMLLRTLQELTVLQEELFAIKLALKNNISPITLGSSRLRTETAGIVACHLLNLMNSLNYEK